MTFMASSISKCFVGTYCQRTLSVLSHEHFFCGNHGVAVDRDCVLDIPRVATGKGHHHWKVSCASDTENEFVALLQSINRERQSAELVFAVGIGPGNVAEQ